MAAEQDPTAAGNLALRQPAKARPPRARKKATVERLEDRIDRNTLVAFFQGDPKSTWLKRRDAQAKRQRNWGFLNETLSLPLSALEPHPLHPRKHPKAAEVVELAHSIRFHGLGQALIVMRQPDDPQRYWVLDGLRRLKAVQSKGLAWQEIRCQVSEGMSRHHALALMLALDSHIKAYSPIEKGAAFLKLREELGITQLVLARYLQVDQAYICRYEKLANALQEEIREACLGDEQFKEKHLRQLARLQELPNVQVEVFQRMRQEDWNSQRVQEEVDRVLNMVPAFSQQYRLELDNQLFKVIIRRKVPTPISVDNLKAQLLLMNQKFFQVYGLSMDDLADWYDRVADYIRQQRRAASRQAQSL